MRMYKMTTLSCSLSFLVTVALMAAEPAKTALVGEDLSTWRESTSDWVVVGEAKMDSDNAKLLSTSPGAGH